MMKQKTVNETEFNQFILKDYGNKITPKLYCLDGDNKQKVEDINRVIIFFNYCFYSKNNFFIDKLDKNFIKDLSNFYHNLKTNILTEENVFSSVSEFINTKDNERLSKLIKFIFKSYLHKYKELKDNDEIIIKHINDIDTLRLISYL